jgi:hypothetical protein
LRAVYAGGMLTLFDGNQMTGVVRLPPHYAELMPLGWEVLVWNGKSAWVVDPQGSVVRRAELPWQIDSAIVDDLGFAILARLLYRFNRF